MGNKNITKELRYLDYLLILNLLLKVVDIISTYMLLTYGSYCVSEGNPLVSLFINYLGIIGGLALSFLMHLIAILWIKFMLLPAYYKITKIAVYAITLFLGLVCTNNISIMFLVL